MSNEPIQVGDLVVVIRALCPCTERALGRIATVTDIGAYNIECLASLHRFRGVAAANLSDPHWQGYMPLSHLRRIKPLGELETEKTAERVPA